MNKRRRYLAKRRRAVWNRLHIRALTSWSTLTKVDGEFEQKLISHSYRCWPEDVDLAVVLAAH